MADGTDCIDDSHKAATNSAEDALDLEAGMSVESSGRADAGSHTQETTAPILKMKSFSRGCFV